MIVKPEIVVTPDYPKVFIREPREAVDLDVEIPKILQVQGWDVGTSFRILFLSHDRQELLAYAEFIVTASTESLETVDTGPASTMTKAVKARRWAQIGDWWEAKKETHPKAEAAAVKWNPGKKAFDVVRGDEVIASFTKDEGGKEAAEAFLQEKQAA